MELLQSNFPPFAESTSHSWIREFARSDTTIVVESVMRGS